MTKEASVKRAWILTALGNDRPGIVASVTKVLFQLGCNLEDSTMTRLGGEFTIMLMFTAPARLTQLRLERTFQALSRRLKLATHLQALTASEARAKASRSTYLISVYGADHPGIVYRVSELLARRWVNITDISTHRTGGKGKPLYLMLLEVELPARVSASTLEPLLKRAGKRLGVEVTIRPADANVL